MLSSRKPLTLEERTFLYTVSTFKDLTFADLQSMHKQVRISLLVHAFPQYFNRTITLKRLGPNAYKIPTRRTPTYLFVPREIRDPSDAALEYTPATGAWRLPQSRKFVPAEFQPQTLGDAWLLLDACNVDLFTESTVKDFYAS